MAASTPLLTVVINTKNAGKTLRACLESIKRLADEIVVMDMHSTDNTIEIAKRYGAKIGTYKDVGYVEPARNAAIKMATGEWILILDADEEIPPSLATYIREKLLIQPKADAYFLPRKNYIFEKWVHTGWWPDALLRLFRKGVVSWPDEIHAVPSITGSVEYIAAKDSLAIVHHNYETVDEYVDRAQKYSKIVAKQNIREKHSLAEPFGPFFDEVIRRYYAWGGNNDGTHGLMLSALQGATKILESSYHWEAKEFSHVSQNAPLSSIFAKAARDAKFWELQQKVEKNNGLSQVFWKFRKKIHVVSGL